MALIILIILFCVWGNSSKNNYFPAKKEVLNQDAETMTRYIILSERRSSFFQYLFGYKVFQFHSTSDYESSSYDAEFDTQEAACNHIKFMNAKDIITPLACKN